MKNEKVFGMIRESCTVAAPDVFPRLDFAAAEEYKNTVSAPSPKKSYIKAAVIYAAACLVLVIALPFIIGNVTDHEPTKPGDNVPPVKTETTDPKGETKESTINAEDINEVYNKVDPDTLSDKVTVEEVEKIIDAVRLAYDDYDVIVLGDGSKITTTPKKPEITEDELDYMTEGDPEHEEYREYFKKLYLIARDAIIARFPEKSVFIYDSEKLFFEEEKFDIYPAFCVLDIEGSGYADAEKINDKMMGAQNFVSRNICDMIYISGISDDVVDVPTITYEESGTANKTMLFPTEEEYEILTAELPEMRLAIEDEILAAESVRTKEELIKYGYEDILTYDGAFVRRKFECETGDVTVEVYHDLGIKMQPCVTVGTYGDSPDDNGQQKVSVQIWTGFVIIKMELNVELNNPIILPETAEKELRYILNIDYTLDIAEDILSSPGVLQIDEFDLNKYPYTDISKQYPEYDNAVYFPIRVPNNDYGTIGYDYGTIELLYKENHGKSIDIKVTEESYSADEVKHMAEITICLDSCTMRVCVWTDGSNPIVLPPEVEEVLRYILNIEEDGSAAGNTVSLNTELVEDYGLNFDELSAKYGNVTDYSAPRGGTAFKFERGYGFYTCGTLDGVVDWVEYGDGEKYPIVEGDTICYTIEQISAEDFFSGPFDAIRIEDVSKIPGMTHIKTVRGMSAPKEYIYISTFEYEGFYHQNTSIRFYHNTKDEITPSDTADIDTPGAYSDPVTPDPMETVPQITDKLCTCLDGHRTNFNNDTMTAEYSEGCLVETMIYQEYTFSGDILRMFKDGVEVFEGEIHEGMTVQVYHDDVFCREYVVTIKS